MRNKLAEDLKDPSIATIRLYDFRHYFCTKKLNDIGNPYTVMVLMGYKKNSKQHKDTCTYSTLTTTNGHAQEQQQPKKQPN
jgi:hypothetical protein